MEEIEVKEYVRTNNGLIGKVNKIEMAGSGCRFGGEFLTDTIIQFNDGKIYERRVKSKQVLKHSKNIIDLIEVGDIVNGYLVIDKYLLNGEKVVLKTEGNYTNVKCLCNGDIKTILTKEQIENNCYRIGE